MRRDAYEYEPCLPVIEIGLTGGIGSGKSTVAQALVARGATLIDADAVVRDLQAPGSPVLADMVGVFGDDILRSDGSLDRAKVAGVVFGDAAMLARLNDIVHPAVINEMTRRRTLLADSDATVLLDVPLLIETGFEHLGGIIVVDVDPEVAVQRLVEQRGFTVDDARARIAMQMSREERVAHADFVVDNAGDLDALDARITACWAWIMSLPRPKPGGPVVPIRRRGEN